MCMEKLSSIQNLQWKDSCVFSCGIDDQLWEAELPTLENTDVNWHNALLMQINTLDAIKDFKTGELILAGDIFAGFVLFILFYRIALELEQTI